MTVPLRDPRASPPVGDPAASRVVAPPHTTMHPLDSRRPRSRRPAWRPILALATAVIALLAVVGCTNSVIAPDYRAFAYASSSGTAAFPGAGAGLAQPGAVEGGIGEGAYDGVPPTMLPGVDQASFTLAEVIALALVNHPLIAQATAQVALAQSDITAIASSAVPKLKLTGEAMARSNAPASAFGSNTFETGDTEVARFTAELMIPIFSFGRFENGIVMVNRRLDAARADERRIRQQVIATVSGLFFTIRELEAQAQVIDASILALRSQEQQAQALYDEGLIVESEAVLIRLQLSRREQGARELASNLRITRGRLAAAIGREDVFAPIGLSTAPTVLDEASVFIDALSLNAALEIALRHRPDLDSARLEAEALDSEMGVYEADIWPEINGFLRYEATTESRVANKDWGTAGIKLEWDILQGGLVFSRLEAVRARQAAHAALVSQLRTDVVLEVAQARENWVNARANLDVSDESIGHAQANLDVVSARFQQQIATAADLLDAESQLAQARSDKVAAQYGLLRALAELEFACGVRLSAPRGDAATSGRAN